MTNGPLGRELFFFDDNKNVIVVAGIDGPEPPNEILVSIREVINSKLIALLSERTSADLNPSMDIVTVSSTGMLTEEQQARFSRALHLLQLDIKTGLEEIDTDLVMMMEDSITDELDNLGLNVEGSQSKVV